MHPPVDVLSKLYFEGPSPHLAHFGLAPDLIFFLDEPDLVDFSHIYLNSDIWSFLQNNIPASAMTRRNTYVCTDRSNADRHSLMQNGKENR